MVEARATALVEARGTRPPHWNRPPRTTRPCPPQPPLSPLPSRVSPRVCDSGLSWLPAPACLIPLASTRGRGNGHSGNKPTAGSIAVVLPAARAHGGPLPSRYVRRPPPAWGHGTTGGRDHRITYRPAARHEPTVGRGYRITLRTPARVTAHDGPDYHRGSYRAGAGAATRHVPTAGATGYTLPRPVAARVHAIVAHAVIRDYQYPPPPFFVPSPTTRCRAIGPPSGNAPGFFCGVDRRLGCLCCGSPGAPGRRRATPSHLYHRPPRSRGCKRDAPVGPPPRLLVGTSKADPSDHEPRVCRHVGATTRVVARGLGVPIRLLPPYQTPTTGHGD